MNVWQILRLLCCIYNLIKAHVREELTCRVNHQPQVFNTHPFKGSILQLLDTVGSGGRRFKFLPDANRFPDSYIHSNLPNIATDL